MKIIWLIGISSSVVSNQVNLCQKTNSDSQIPAVVSPPALPSTLSTPSLTSVSYVSSILVTPSHRLEDRERERESERESISLSAPSPPPLVLPLLQLSLTLLFDANWMQTEGFPAACWACAPSPSLSSPLLSSPPSSSSSYLRPSIILNFLLLFFFPSSTSAPGCGSRWLCSSLDSLLWSTVSLPASSFNLFWEIRFHSHSNGSSGSNGSHGGGTLF